MIKIVLLVISAEIVTALGHLLFKSATNSVGRHDLRRPGSVFKFVGEVLSKKAIWAGLAAMMAGLAIWVAALAQGDLSLVYSLGSLQYLIILFSAHFFLGEKIERMKVIGTFLVVAGIILIMLS
ncbi:MAG: EamA family transporter [Candidatus Omnitrophica bacterium]|nr:EamA family transporter [Candidatus Omnitrophota bacterium]MCM8791298.1 EamA family transporter [Candidatus Omnitrophota bacterium]